MKSKYKKRILLGLLFVSFLLLTIVPLATYAVGNKDNDTKKNDSPTDEEVAKSLCTPDFIDKYYKISAEPIVLSNGVVTGIKLRAYKNNTITDTDLSFKVIKIGNVELYGIIKDRYIQELKMLQKKLRLLMRIKHQLLDNSSLNILKKNLIKV